VTRYDVVLWDSVAAMPYSLSSTTGLGGTEHAVVRLGRALQERGKSVTIICPHHGGFQPYKISTGALVSLRMSDIPAHSVLPRDRLIVWAHDSGRVTVPLEPHTLVCFTEWQRQGLCRDRVSWRRDIIIPGMLPDCVYNSPRPPREFGRFFYPSAAIKGWDATYSLWCQERRPGDVLRVLASGYDQARRHDDPTVQYLEPLDDQGLVNEVAAAEAIFAVNVFPEIWGQTLAIADALGTPIYYRAIRGFGGTIEVVRAYGMFEETSGYFLEAVRRDYRISTVMPQWLAVLEGP